MNRESTNRVRYVLEELVPPALRDTWLFRWPIRKFWSTHVDLFADFRERAPFLTEEEYTRVYRDYPRIHDQSDNSQACIDRIIKDVVGTSVCDVGCGGGALLRLIREKRPDVTAFGGIDVQLDYIPANQGMDIREGKVESLPFADGSFDTVICTHVLEHVLDIRAAVAELRRIARRRVLIVVPRERECRYNFNPHFHFFPYVHSFLRVMFPIPEHYHVEDIARDIYYREDRA